MKIISSNNESFLMTPELEIELSVIDSGIIFSEIEGKIVIIVKDSEKMVSSLSAPSSIKIIFTYIDRPEFPAVNSDIRVKTEKGLSVKYDYFINAESEYELNLLNEILNQKEISLFLFSDIVRKIRGILPSPVINVCTFSLREVVASCELAHV